MPLRPFGNNSLFPSTCKRIDFLLRKEVQPSLGLFLTNQILSTSELDMSHGTLPLDRQNCQVFGTLLAQKPDDSMVAKGACWQGMDSHLAMILPRAPLKNAWWTETPHLYDVTTSTKEVSKNYTHLAMSFDREPPHKRSDMDSMRKKNPTLWAPCSIVTFPDARTWIPSSLAVT